MLLQQVKSFIRILNIDAILFLGVRLASIVLSITSIFLLCRAVTIQQYFLTDGLGLMYDLLPLGSVSWLTAFPIADLQPLQKILPCMPSQTDTDPSSWHTR